MAFICCCCCCRVSWISCSWIFSCPTSPTWGVGLTGKFWRLNLKGGGAMLFCNVFADGESCTYQQLTGPFQQFSPELLTTRSTIHEAFLCIISVCLYRFDFSFMFVKAYFSPFTREMLGSPL